MFDLDREHPQAKWKARYILDSERKFRENELATWAGALHPSYFSPEAQRYLAHKLDGLISELTKLRDRLTAAATKKEAATKTK